MSSEESSHAPVSPPPTYGVKEIGMAVTAFAILLGMGIFSLTGITYILSQLL